MSVTFSPAPAVERTAEKLIRNHHTHLTDVEIRYVFRSETAKNNGKPIMGKARKLSGLNAYLAQPAGRSGRRGLLRHRDLRACLDRPRCRSSVKRSSTMSSATSPPVYDENTDTVKLALRPHDLEEFRVIVERHGLWQPDVEAFAKTIAQGEFTFNAADEEQ